MNEVFVVGSDDHVFAACFAVFVVLASSLAVIHFWKDFTVEEHVAQDLVPSRGTVAEVAIRPVSTFGSQFQFEAFIHNEFLGDWVVLEGHHAHFDHLHASHCHHF